MTLFGWLRKPKKPDSPPFCAGCAARDNEIRYLREHVETLLDRIMVLTGTVEAQKAALMTPGDELPREEYDPPESEAEAIAREEAEQERIFAEAAQEIERFEAETGLPKGALKDVG